MTDQTWTWASLDDRGLALVQEAEQTLGSDIVLVYAPSGRPRSVPVPEGLRPAELDGSQLECIQGLEKMVNGVAVAYQLVA